MKTLLICIGLVIGASPANAQLWKQSERGDVRLAWVEAGTGNKIEFQCDSKPGHEATKITFTINHQRPPVDTLAITFDNLPTFKPTTMIEPGEVSSGCSACMAEFELLRDRFKKHQAVAVSVQGSAPIEFTLLGSTKSIGDCPSDGEQNIN